MDFNRRRLRPVHSAEQLDAIYAEPHRSDSHPDHVARVQVCASLIQGRLPQPGVVADLSCGDGYIARHIGASRIVLGDMAPGYPIHGPLEKTLQDLGHVRLYVCTETLEHLDDPDLVLRLIRAQSDWLLLSTPIDAWGDPNIEHYWAWGRRGVERMLGEAGFSVDTFVALDFRPAGSHYCFGIWLAS